MIWDVWFALGYDPETLIGATISVFVLGGAAGAFIALLVFHRYYEEAWSEGVKDGISAATRPWRNRGTNERGMMVSLYLELKKLAEEGLAASTKEGQRAALKSILERVNTALDTQKDWKRKPEKRP